MLKAPGLRPARFRRARIDLSFKLVA